MSNFAVFAKAVKNRFDLFLKEENLYVVDSNAEDIWHLYLSTFPAKYNPIFRTRAEYDCSCCKNFIRSIGNVVAIQNGVIATLWDLNTLPEPYQEVADALSAYIKALPIRDIFLSKEKKFGTELSRALIDGTLFQWNHFCVEVNRKFIDRDKVAKCGEARTTHDVLRRSLQNLKVEAISSVRELIEDKKIYRGREFANAVNEFARLKDRYDTLSPDKQDIFVWQNIKGPACRFKNTVIGTLVSDLSEDVAIEDAVRMYESKVAPQNYKRTSSLITKSMIEDANKTIQDLDLELALERRHAKFSDIDINDVLFVDNSVSDKFKNSTIKNLLLEEVKPIKFDLAHAKEISIKDFLNNVLPKTTSLSLYLENRHRNNFVSLTAPVHKEVAPLFRWKNNIAWSYVGNFTDSIKERVKQAGGMVENVDLRVSLAWFNTDDLDLHINTPARTRIFYGHKQDYYTNGYLDVDMNVVYYRRDAVENIRFKNLIKDGEYTVLVNNFTKRENIDVGFTVEVEYDGKIETLTHEKALASNSDVGVCKITVKNHKVCSVVTSDKNVIRGAASKDIWGVKTQSLIKVNSLIASPNYWQEGEEGNKHWFFILEGCKNPEPTRGIYNEYLNANLIKHRRVFEILGDKTKCPVTVDQMSGVGFSFTKKDSVSVVAMGPKLNQLYTIVF